MSNSNITLVIPVYNREKLLGRTLDSIAAQTRRPLEVTLVDNVSTDSSLQMCLDFRDRHAADGIHTTVLVEPRPGAPKARNCGLAACRTPYVYFFDSDDELSPDFLERMEARLARQGCDLCVFPTREVIGRRTRRRPYQAHVTPHGHILSSMLNTQGMIFRTEWLRQLGGWNERLNIWMDWELGLRAMLAGPAVSQCGGKAFHRIHIHRDSITGQNYTINYKKIMNALEEAWRDIEKAACSDRLKRKCRAALYYRTMIMGGKLESEGSFFYAHLFITMPIIEKYPPNPFRRLAGQLLRYYTRFGGRGAWRLALLLP